MIAVRRPDVTITGVDLIVRPETHVPVTPFDGNRISFDVVMFVDILHHTEDPETLLAEARRVASQAVVLKDHTRDGIRAGSTLRFMDGVGNAPHGIPPALQLLAGTTLARGVRRARLDTGGPANQAGSQCRAGNLAVRPLPARQRPPQPSLILDAINQLQPLEAEIFNAVQAGGFRRPPGTTAAVHGPASIAESCADLAGFALDDCQVVLRKCGFVIGGEFKSAGEIPFHCVNIGKTAVIDDAGK